MTNFSPNMLKTFETCARKYWFKYVQKISAPQKTSYFEKGKKVHALANYYLRGDDISKLEKALNSEERKVWENLKKNEFFQKIYVTSEYNLSCKVGEYWIGGRLDALVTDTDCHYEEGNALRSNPINNEIATQSKIARNDKKTYYILDYKTGQIPKNPEYDYQTMVYLLCLNKKLQKINEITTPQNAARNDMSLRGNEATVAISSNLKFVYIDLKNNQNCVIDFDKDYETPIIEICNKIKNAQPNVERSKKCDFCEYRKICF